MSRTQKALRLMAQELRSQRILLEKLLDGVLLQESSIRTVTRKQTELQNLVGSMKVVTGEVFSDLSETQGRQTQEIGKLDKRVRVLETLR